MLRPAASCGAAGQTGPLAMQGGGASGVPLAAMSGLLLRPRSRSPGVREAPSLRHALAAAPLATTTPGGSSRVLQGVAGGVARGGPQQQRSPSPGGETPTLRATTTTTSFCGPPSGQQPRVTSRASLGVGGGAVGGRPSLQPQLSAVARAGGSHAGAGASLGLAAARGAALPQQQRLLRSGQAPLRQSLGGMSRPSASSPAGGGTSSTALAASCARPTATVVPLASRPAVVPSQAEQPRQRGGEAEAAVCGLGELPFELVQAVTDWLPTFGSRAKLRELYVAARSLEWRRAAPHVVKEAFSHSSLGDLGCEAVAAGLAQPQNAGLKELCLGANGITDRGAEALASALRGGLRLRRLSLRDNHLQDRGAHALAEALTAGSALEELDLWGNDGLSECGKLAMLRAVAPSCEVFVELPLVQPQPCKHWNLALDDNMRSILFDWISQVHESMASAVEGGVDPQTMLLRTYSHVDAYLARRPVPRADVELIGLACSLLSTGLVGRAGGSDAEDSFECMELANFLAFSTDGAVTGEQVAGTARSIREVLGASLHQPTVYTFLRRYLRQTGWTEASFSLANYLVELAAAKPAFLEFRPQVVAAAAAVLSRQYVSQGVGVRTVPEWKSKLLRCADLDLRRELAPCAALLSRWHAAQRPKVQPLFVHQKFTSSKLSAVARLRANPPAEAAFFVQVMTDLAA